MKRLRSTDRLQVEGKIQQDKSGGASEFEGAEDENAKLTQMLADAMLNNVALKDLLGKNGDARRARHRAGQA